MENCERLNGSYYYETIYIMNMTLNNKARVINANEERRLSRFTM